MVGRADEDPGLSFMSFTILPSPWKSVRFDERRLRKGGEEGLTDKWISPSDMLAVMSVDLGSESMKVAIVKPGVPMEIVLNK